MKKIFTHQPQHTMITEFIADSMWALGVIECATSAKKAKKEVPFHSMATPNFLLNSANRLIRFFKL